MLWPSQMLVWCDFRCWGHPRWKKSLRGPWSAFAHANLCSKRLISHFGVSPHPKLCSKCLFGPVDAPWASKILVWCEFWFLVPPTCWKSITGPGKAFAPPNICSKSIFGTFGVPTYSKFGQNSLFWLLVYRDPHPDSCEASFDFEGLQLVEARSGSWERHFPHQIYVPTAYLGLLVCLFLALNSLLSL